MTIKELIPAEWANALHQKVPASVFESLDTFLTQEYESHTVYPEYQNIFKAIDGLRPEDVHVIILGQDPYHEPGQAHGLSFSVQDGQPLPKSLVNIYRELCDDIGCNAPKSGDLTRWKEQGVLLLNTVLTVREHEANSHKDRGWETITAAILDTVLETTQPKIFVLWGAQASQSFDAVYQPYIRKHFYAYDVEVLHSAHPSPLSAYRGFFGSKPFSRVNDWLTRHGVAPIQWA